MAKERYIGVKFLPVRLGGFNPDNSEKKLIIQLIAAGKIYGKLGMLDKNGGNLSVRCSGGILIKRTGSYPTKLRAGDFVKVAKTSPKKVYYYGRHLPSSEARFHAGIYRARPDINCVLHAHDFAAIGAKTRLAGVGYIREISYGTLASANAVKAAAKNHDYLIQKNHGIIALGRNVKSALNLMKKYHAKFSQPGQKAAKDN